MFSILFSWSRKRSTLALSSDISGGWYRSAGEALSAPIWVMLDVPSTQAKHR